MFGIGLSEMIVICCVIVIFVRPKDLPKIFRRLGKSYARLRNYYRELAAIQEQFLKDIQAASRAPETRFSADSDPPASEPPRERAFPEPEAQVKNGDPSSETEKPIRPPTRTG